MKFQIGFAFQFLFALTCAQGYSFYQVLTEETQETEPSGFKNGLTTYVNIKGGRTDKARESLG